MITALGFFGAILLFSFIATKYEECAMNWFYDKALEEMKLRDSS